MENLFTHLEQVVLRMDSRFCTEDGHLLKNNVVEAALALDPQLLHYLLADEKLHKQFFRKVDGLLVFDKVQFQRFVMNKQFLPDSYTSFKNKVGLTNENGEFLSESREIVLSWPYKDCMLEGGQTKEDAKRNEIFWSETLAPDEINRLTEPKALCNFRRYDSKGEHEATELRPDDNLIIKGNNLLALYSLRQRFRGKVKLIYIDPPYNTGNDSFGYNDSFNHSTWLTFMKNRLEVAKELLSPDGCIFVHCDDHEQAYLKILMDTIFSPQYTFDNCIAIKVSPANGVKITHANRTILKEKEYILFYKSSSTSLNPQYIENKEWDKHYNLFIENRDKDVSQWKVIPISQKIDNLQLGEQDLSNPKFAKWAYANAECIFQLVAPSEAIKNNPKYMSEYIQAVEELPGYFAYKGKQIHFASKTIKETLDGYKFSKLACDWWHDIAFNNLFQEGNVLLKAGKKPEKLLQRIISLTTVEGDIVLDFFGGSGTTAATAHKMRRNYISCEQLPEHIDLICTRLYGVINNDISGISKSVHWNPQNPDLLDGDKYAHNSFVYCELAQANQQLVDEIMAANEPLKLQEVWALLQEKGFLSYKISPKLINEHAEDFNDLSLEDQKRFLIECLDKNMLYIPYSDIDDEGFTLSENDKQLTRQFYASR